MAELSVLKRLKEKLIGKAVVTADGRRGMVEDVVIVGQADAPGEGEIMVRMQPRGDFAGYLPIDRELELAQIEW